MAVAKDHPVSSIGLPPPGDFAFSQLHILQGCHYQHNDDKYLNTSPIILTNHDKSTKIQISILIILKWMNLSSVNNFFPIHRPLLQACDRLKETNECKEFNKGILYHGVFTVCDKVCDR